MSLSMVDVAYQVLGESSKGMNFVDLWKKVCDKMGYCDKNEVNKMSQFFTNISLDNRFAQIDNVWDLRVRHKLEDVTIDLEALEIEDDEDEEVVFDEEVKFSTEQEEE